MAHRLIICVLAGVTLTAAAPILAKPGGGGGNGNAGGHMGVGMGGGHGFGHSGFGTNSGNLGGGGALDMRMGSSFAHHGTQLTGLTNGMNVVDTGGASVGTVTNISYLGNGRVRNVQVTLVDGRRILLAPDSLALNGGVLSTNSLTTTVKSQGVNHASVNGLAHSSPKSGLNSAGITTFAGLAAGMPVNNGIGTNIGTVSGIVLNRSGAVVGIRVALNGGGTALIPAPSLGFNGSVVTTSFVPKH